MNWIVRHRRFAFAAICLFWAAVIAVSYLPPWEEVPGLTFLNNRLPAIEQLPFVSLPKRGQQIFEDVVLRREGRKTATRNDFVFVGIDQQSLQLDAIGPEEIRGNRAFELMTERPYPWSREVWALLLNRLFGAGARLIAFDIVYNQPGDGDAAFRAALDRYRDRVVVGMNIDTQHGAQIVVPNAGLISPPAEQDDRVGFVNYWNDALDGKLRATRFFTSDRELAGQNPVAGEPVYGSLPQRVLTKLGQEQVIPHDQQEHLFRFSADGAYPAAPLWEMFHPKLWQANYGDGVFFKDKIVIVGASSQIAHDVIDTPIDPATPGPALHLQVVAATAAHEFLYPTLTSVVLALVFAGAIVAWALITFVRRPVLSLLALIAVTGLYLLAARIAYDASGLLLATVPPLATFLLGGVSTLGTDYAIERREKLRTRRTLERYVSKNLVKEVLENPGGYYSSMRGARMPVTILFSDLVGFTTLSEYADPEELVRHLNEYLSRMVAVVFENDGTLDKFIGDAIMAVWGNVKSQGVAKDAKACAQAALGMRRELRKLNDKWKEEGRMLLGMGVGINHGEALVGNIGSYEPHERLDPTVIGDAVNLASRLEGLTRIYGVDILVGPKAAELIRDEFYLRSVARAQVKGKSEAVDVFTIIDSRDHQPPAEQLIWLETYEEGIRKFRERDFTESKILFSRFLEFYPSDYLAKLYLDRALEYEQAPPDGEWHGVEVFYKK